MKFNFFPNASRVVQFVYFPALVGYEKSEKAFGALINELLNPGSLDRWERISDELAQYKEEISKYILSSYSFYFKLLFRIDLKSITTEEEYLSAIRSLSKRELDDHMTGFLESVLDMSLPTMDQSENYVSAVFKLISASTLDHSDKWKLFALLENPEAVRDQYADFKEGLIPLHRKYYTEVEYAVNAWSNSFALELETTEQTPLSYIMDQYLVAESAAMFKQSSTINFWLLGIHDYNYFFMNPSPNESNIFLGINVLEYLSRLNRFETRNKEERMTVFKNLSDKTRYEVLKLIANGESSTKVLAQKLGVTSAAISYHLKQLSNDRLIRFDANSPKQRYRINESRLREALAGLHEDLCL